MHPVEVALIHWPRDGAERERLAEAMLPRLLLVPDDVEPPVVRRPHGGLDPAAGR